MENRLRGIRDISRRLLQYIEQVIARTPVGEYEHWVWWVYKLNLEMGQL